VNAKTSKLLIMKTTNRIFKSLSSAFLPLLVMFAFATSAVAQTEARIVFSAPVSTLISAKPARYATCTQILSMNSDGSGVTQLTSGAVNSDNPAWSPGQQYIAFTRGTEVTVMHANGSGAFPVAVAVGAGVSSLSWSANGTEVAFTSADENNDLYVVSVDPPTHTAATPTLLAAGPSYDVNWSPDGTKVAFDRYDSSGNSAIIVHEVATGAEYSFSDLATASGAPGSWGPSWSPSGTMLAFGATATVKTTTKKGTTTTTIFPLFIANANGTDLLQVTPSSSEGGYLPTWSPDGTTLAFVSAANGEIYKTVIGSDVLTFLNAGTAPDWNP
jgi:Tol biopolymer transport system component